MIMLPAVTSSPPNAFTPSRLLTLSRPLRELPCPFLCAMTKSPAVPNAFGTAYNGPLYDDFFDFQNGMVRANAAFAVVTFTAAKFERNDFRSLLIGVDDF